MSSFSSLGVLSYILLANEGLLLCSLTNAVFHRTFFVVFALMGEKRFYYGFILYFSYNDGG